MGGEGAGTNVADLCFVVAACEANEVTPIANVTDVFFRVSIHPAVRIDEVAPDAWTSAEG